jgi:hypothetical protein
LVQSSGVMPTMAQITGTGKVTTRATKIAAAAR